VLTLDEVETICYVAKKLRLSLPTRTLSAVLEPKKVEELEDKQLVSIYYSLATAPWNADPQLVLRLQTAILARLGSLSSGSLHLVQKTLLFFRQGLAGFSEAVEQEIAAKSCRLEFANAVCDVIYHKLKNQRLRHQFYKPLLKNLRKNLLQCEECVEVLSLARAVNQISKFEDLLDLKHLLLKKVAEESSALKETEVCFIYS